MTKKELLESEDLHSIIYNFLSYKDGSISESTSDAIEEFIEKELKKLKPVLFTTEDGVEIRIDDRYVIVLDDFTIISNILAIGNQDESEKKFSTNWAANQWIFMNKPAITLKDLEDVGLDYLKILNDIQNLS